MNEQSCLTVILAAGEGTRMNSARAKVMHALAGVPMLGHVMDAAGAAGIDAAAMVIGPGMDEVRSFALARNPDAQIFVQEQRLGTAHAVLCAAPALERPADHVIVLYGDTPLITAATLQRLRALLSEGADVAVLGFRADDPGGYGRLLIASDGRLVAIREERDASANELAITLCNSGVMALRGRHVLKLLHRIGNDNARKEYYLTDAIELAVADGLHCAVLECPQSEVLGVNSRAQLAAAEAILQDRLRLEAMEAGVTMIAPGTVHLSTDTRFARDVLIEPHVFFGPGVSVGENSTIKAFSHLEGARIGEGVTIGPFARLRPGAVLGPDTRIGNFVEVKNATLGQGAKVNHLSYVGDASVGQRVNIGAGTITCNYDGFAKHRTVIGDDAFIGSNSALVAPVSVGNGAYVGSGSVITRDVEADALALERAEQVTRPGWAARARQRRGQREH